MKKGKKTEGGQSKPMLHRLLSVKGLNLHPDASYKHIHPHLICTHITEHQKTYFPNKQTQTKNLTFYGIVFVYTPTKTH